MKMRLVSFCLASIAAAGDLSGLYPAAKLATEKPRFEKRLKRKRWGFSKTRRTPSCCQKK